MTAFTTVHHVGLSVSDLDRSVAFYTDVLGLTFVMPTDAPGFTRALLVHQASGFFLGLTQHDANDATPFREANAGLDHLAFAVADRDELSEWEDRLAEKGVTYSPIEDVWYGAVLSFRDPDGIQLELFVAPNGAAGGGTTAPAE